MHVSQVSSNTVQAFYQPTNLIETMLENFRSITVNDLANINLLSRYDTKFIFPKNRLKRVFYYLAQDYRILKIGGRRLFAYETLYYDTDDLFFYRQHHDQKLGRYKVRCRRYVQSDQCFFEVKFKNNKKKTTKKRLPLKDKTINYAISETSKEFARGHIFLNDSNIMEKIKPKLKVDYHRMTFADAVRKERLTIDTGLTYSGKTLRHQLDNLIIAELKSERFSPHTPLFQYLKELKIHPVKFSKYCMGVVITRENIKYNRFKKNLLSLRKIEKGR